jgi:hypothetical protein
MGVYTERKDLETQKRMSNSGSICYSGVCALAHQLIRISHADRDTSKAGGCTAQIPTQPRIYRDRELSTVGSFVWANLVLNSLLGGIGVFVRNYSSA